MQLNKISEGDAKDIVDNLARIATEVLGISDKQARLRVKAIVDSGILSKFGPPSGMPFQVAIDAAIQIPQPE